MQRENSLPVDRLFGGEVKGPPQRAKPSFRVPLGMVQTRSPQSGSIWGPRLCPVGLPSLQHAASEWTKGSFGSVRQRPGPKGWKGVPSCHQPTKRHILLRIQRDRSLISLSITWRCDSAPASKLALGDSIRYLEHGLKVCAKPKKTGPLVALLSWFHSY